MTKCEVTAELSSTGQHLPPGRTNRPEAFAGQRETRRAAVITSPADQMPARPDSLLFGGVRLPECRVVKPFRVEVGKHEGSIVAFAPEVGEFGQGKSLSAALDDLGQTIAELFRSLNASDAHLGDDLLALRDTLRAHLRARKTA